MPAVVGSTPRQVGLRDTRQQGLVGPSVRRFVVPFCSCSNDHKWLIDWLQHTLHTYIEAVYTGMSQVLRGRLVSPVIASALALLLVEFLVERVMFPWLMIDEVCFVDCITRRNHQLAVPFHLDAWPLFLFRRCSTPVRRCSTTESSEGDYVETGEAFTCVVCSCLALLRKPKVSRYTFVVPLYSRGASPLLRVRTAFLSYPARVVFVGQVVARRIA